MNLNRRAFLHTSLAAGGFVGLGSTMPRFLERTALAAPKSSQAGAKDTILVVVQLTGGNDGLNTVVPFKDPEYAKLRPTLKLPEAQLKKVTDDIGLHPSLTGFAELLEDQALCIVQGVGYPNPSQSHFRSMDIWQAADTAQTLTEGWIGKALKHLPETQSFHLSERESSPLALTGAPVRVPTIQSLEEFQLRVAAMSKTDRQEQQAIIEGATQSTSGKPNLLDFVQQTAANTYASSKRLQEIGKNYQPKVPYPNTALANRLKLAAQLIDADLGARLFYVALDGFDTHANQANAHANLMQQLSGAVTAFYKDMAARGHKDRLLIMTFSEFGRRARENGSRGTDHGSAAPMFLVSGKVKPGLVGAHPSLTQLEAGNLKFHTDFRRVYAAVLENWLGVSSQQVLGQPWQPLEVFQG
ncbi:MAG: DUF1501 domain-containing protein [Gemmataceae bacterium]